MALGLVKNRAIRRSPRLRVRVLKCKYLIRLSERIPEYKK